MILCSSDLSLEPPRTKFLIEKMYQNLIERGNDRKDMVNNYIRIERRGELTGFLSMTSNFLLEKLVFGFGTNDLGVFPPLFVFIALLFGSYRSIITLK